MKVQLYPFGSARIALMTFLHLLVTGSGILGCTAGTAGPEVPPAQALRLRFPDQAGAVLAPEEGFVSTAEGFALAASTALPGLGRQVEVTLPHDARGALRLRGPSGFEVQVRELGVEGEGAVAERAVAYRRAGGTSFWTAAPGGVEEWLHLEAGAVRKGEPVAVWEIAGATVRSRGEGAEFVDGGGVVRLSVTAPAAYAAGGQQIRAWMAGRRTRLELWVEAEGQEVLIDPLWSPAGSMTDARFTHTATLLPSGQVLVVGGTSSVDKPLASVELFDSATDTWKSASALPNDRSRHTATLLPSGQVLVARGYNSTQDSLVSAELYDPATNSWKLAAPLTTGYGDTATLLPSGQVLVVGGYISGGDLTSAELYDPATNSWKPAASLATARSGHTATLLPSGQVLVVGGYNLASAELYDPATNTWKPAASLTNAHYRHTATLLPSGQVLVVGGIGSGVKLTSAELYDPATNTWKPAASLTNAHYGHTATLLPSGQVLVVGGGYTDVTASAELYDPATNSWVPQASLATARYGHTATLLPSGQVLVVGGVGPGGVLASAELYPPCTSSSECPSSGGECDQGLCDVKTGTCLVTHKLDGVPCKGGVCIAGGCFMDASSSSNSGTGSTTSAGGGASTGSNTGSTASSSRSSTSSAGPSGGDGGAGGSAEEIRFRGGACGISSDPTNVAPWFGLGLLLILRRRPRSRGQVRPGK